MRVERGMTWCGAWASGDGALLRRSQPAALKAEDESLVEAFVRHDHELAARIKDYAVRMGGRLLARVWPGPALQCHQLGWWLQLTVLTHRQHRDRTGLIIRHNQKALGWI